MSIRKTFFDQANACSALGSPFTGKLLELLGQNLSRETAIGARVLDWQGDASNHGDAVALRLAGALHALVLQKKHATLTEAYPPNDASEDQLWQAVQLALREDAGQIQQWMNSPPQTNEVRRSAALMPVFLSLQEQFGLPLVTSELGASAGLNLNWDMFHLTLNNVGFGKPSSTVHLSPSWTGPLPPNCPPAVIGKAGCDLNPLDPEHDSLRLRAYIWPDQTARMARTKAAIEIARKQQVPVACSDAESWLKQRLATRHTGAVHVVYHTIAWQYFPKDTQMACTTALHAAGEAATPNAPIAWVSLEADGKGHGAGLRAMVWPPGQEYDLGRADFHGRWVNWNGFTSRHR